MNHFLYQKADETFLYIYYDGKNSSLSMRRYSKKGVRSNATVLRQNIEKDFYCSADKKGALHIVFAAVGGGIHYGYFTENTFRSFQVLSAKTPMNYKKHLMISACTDPVCIFYTIRHNNKTILSMQTVNSEDNSSTTPQALDYISEPEAELGLCETDYNNVFLSYPREAENTCNNVMRELKRDGSTVRILDYLPEEEAALSIDSFYMEEGTLKLAAHPLGLEHLYLITHDAKTIPEKVDIQAFPRGSKTFFGLIPVYGKLHCYLCSESNLYACILRGGTTSVQLERQSKQFGGSIQPIHTMIQDLCSSPMVLPGNLASGNFFCLFNPFTDIKNSQEIMDLSRIMQVEKRLAALEGHVKRLDSIVKEMDQNLKIPRDVVGPDFDT